MHQHLFFAVLVLFTGLLQAVPSPSAELGSQPIERCYYGKDLESQVKALKPCYVNPNFDSIQPCCVRGDYCLKNNACYSPKSKITYQYGCTDPSYRDPACPKKCDLDMKGYSKWVGLVYCNGTNGNPDNTWLCHHPDACRKNCKPGDRDQSCKDRCPQMIWDPEVGQPLPYIECGQLDVNKVAINAGSPLGTLFNIPADEAEYISYIESRRPKPPSTALPSSALPSGQSTSTVPTVTTTTLSNSSSSPTSAGSSTVASATSTTPPGSGGNVKSGRPPWVTPLALGLGIPLGIALIGLLSFYIVRRRKKGLEAAKANSGDESQNNTHESGAFEYKAELPAAQLDPVELDSTAVAPSEAGGYPNSSGTSPMVSPINSEFTGTSRMTGYEGGSGPRDRWSITVNGDTDHPVYELEG